MFSAPTSPPHQLQSYRLLVYRSVVHPEFFRIADQRIETRRDYEMESWIARGTHMMRFQCGDYCVVEVITPDDRGFPHAGRLKTIPCAGERDHAQLIGDRIQYTTAVQTELLEPNLYKSYLKEMIEFARQNDGLIECSAAKSSKYDNVSILCIQSLKYEVHAQTWHLDASCGLIVRSQAIFEVAAPAETPN